VKENGIYLTTALECIGHIQEYIQGYNLKDYGLDELAQKDANMLKPALTQRRNNRNEVKGMV